MSYFAKAGGLVLVSVSIFGGQAAFAGPLSVIDSSNLAQAKLMVSSLESQVQTMKAQYTAITSNHNFGTILNNTSLTSYLPSQWSSVYSNIRSGSLNSLGSAATQVINDEGMTSTTSTQARYNQTLAANKAMTMQAYDASAARLANIQSLMNQSNLTEDASAKADLQNRISAENAMIQNEQTRLNMMSKLEETEEKLSEKQDVDNFRNVMMGDAKLSQ